MTIPARLMHVSSPSSTACRMSRRAAHFARFGAANDEEEEEGNNPHTGGSDVRTQLSQNRSSSARCIMRMQAQPCTNLCSMPDDTSPMQTPQQVQLKVPMLAVLNARKR